MRRLLCLAIAAGALFTATEARAQFANRSLGLSLGYLKMNADPTVEWGLPLSLEGSLYIEGGFDLVLRVPLMLLTESVTGKQIVATGGNLGIRYLLSEEQIRPYVGAELAFLHIFRELGTADFVGIGPFGGVDFFIGDSVTLGARAFVDFYIALNAPLTTGVGVQAVATSYF